MAGLCLICKGWIKVTFAEDTEIDAEGKTIRKLAMEIPPQCVTAQSCAEAHLDDISRITGTTNNGVIGLEEEESPGVMIVD